jgi:hypothetical protein
MDSPFFLRIKNDVSIHALAGSATGRLGGCPGNKDSPELCFNPQGLCPDIVNIGKK